MRKAGFIICLLLVICSCSKQSQKISEKKTTQAASKQITIGFSIDTLAIERWQRDLDVFINTAKELGANVIVQNAGSSIEEQNRQLLYLLERNVDAIVILPKDADCFSETIQKIRSKGIPVISYDRLTLNADISLYLTIDSQKVGEKMATAMLHQNHGPNWYLMLGPEEDYNMTLIKEGLSKVLRNSQISTSHIFYTDDWNYDLSYQEMVRIISNGEIPDAIVCGNDAVAASVLQAINRYLPDQHIPICGQDADITACQYIVQGKQDYTVYKPIARLAELAAKYAVYLAKGEDIYEKDMVITSINNGYGDIPAIWLEPILVDKNNLDEVIIASGFHTASSIYGTNQHNLNNKKIQIYTLFIGKIPCVYVRK